MDLNNFVIDRVMRAVGFSQTDDSVLFAINQVTNPSLNVTSETAEAVDALGTPIAVFNRAKNAEFSAENALFDLNLMATQAGTVKEVASAENTIVTPKFDVIDFVKGTTSYTLAQTPIDIPATIHVLNGDGTFGTAYTLDNGDFSVSGKTLTVSVEDLADCQLMVIYEYNAAEAVSVTNSAINFPKACKLVLEVLGCDVCDQTKLIYAYLVLPNFKISTDFDWSIATDGTHPFSGQAMQDYCDKEKKLYQLIIPA